ncbi:glutathione peroxidase [Xanthovirga aplysinae]|uniref:glutathione peroxidase n=1 Tax=Xanthovirga aplysinae TaxID=2529853 RepID=UPI0012BCDF38|nr:glutathione peroxidase [Xanthovirga aplysinae]MTI33079.1 glutathione peroxidase [Xanthovirga aplysinae]
MKSLFDFKLKAIDGQTVDLSQFKGKKVLIVNVASKCGFTPQYADLEALYQQHSNKVAVLAFPSNDFGSQEPGSNKEIQQFCQRNYKISFPLFEKISVVGDSMHPLFRWLTNTSGHKPNWNFCKYLIDEKGQVMKFYPSTANPFEIFEDMDLSKTK